MHYTGETEQLKVYVLEYAGLPKTFNPEKNLEFQQF